MKVKLPEKTGICIQGPTDYWEVYKHWRQFDCPIVWSTWETEPAKRILEIERGGIEVVLSPVPKWAGFWNYNMQSVSTHAGLTRLKEMGVEHALKVRGDQIFGGVQWVWWDIIGCDIAFFCSYNPVSKTCYWAKEMSYYLDGIYHIGCDYVADYIVFGQMDTMLHVFGGLEKFPRPGPVPSEALLLKRWLDYRGLEHNFNPKYLKSNGLVYWKESALKSISNGNAVDFFSLKTEENFIILGNNEFYITE